MLPQNRKSKAIGELLLVPRSVQTHHNGIQILVNYLKFELFQVVCLIPQDEMRHEAAESALHTKAAVQAAQGNYVGAAISEVGPLFSF